MMDAGRHPQIEILTSAELIALDGEPGAFRATVRLRSTAVDPERCTGCGDCAEACPVLVQNAFDIGLGGRHAIFRPFPQAVPSAFVIDPDACLNDGRLIACERCRLACQSDAIDLGRGPAERAYEVGAVVVATGFEEFDPSPLRNFGYGVYPNVMTALELERLLNASGPTKGQVMRPSDRRAPKRLAFVQCVGSRGEAGRTHCSRFCCMNAAKDALLLKQHDAEIESVTILYTDRRACGKGFEEFMERARAAEGVRFVRGRPAKITEQADTRDLEIAVEDTETGRPLHVAADLVVLSCGAVPSEGAQELAARLGLDLSPAGFFEAGTDVSAVATSRPGIFLCGGATGPLVIPDCVAQGSAAAAEAAALLAFVARASEPASGERAPGESESGPGAGKDAALRAAGPHGAGGVPEANALDDAEEAALGDAILAGEAVLSHARPGDGRAAGASPSYPWDGFANEANADLAAAWDADAHPHTGGETGEDLRPNATPADPQASARQRDGALREQGDATMRARHDATMREQGDDPEADASVTSLANSDAPARVGVFLCHCGVNIAGVLAMPELLQYAQRLPGVAHASEELFACSSSSQNAIQQAIREKGITRVVVAACTPRTHEPVFRRNCAEAGLNPYLLEMVNIRDQCSWVHASTPGLATAKARDLLRMAVARAQRLEALTPVETPVEQSALVIGAGLAGLKAASDLAALGCQVTVVEAASSPDALLADLDSLAPQAQGARETAAALIERARERGVTLLLGREVSNISGFVGNFRIELAPTSATPPAPASATLTAGAIVIAIGARPYEPRGEFGHGRLANVIASLDLEERMARDEAFGNGAAVAFVQCVGSRHAVDEDAATMPGAAGNEREADGRAAGRGKSWALRGCSRVCCPTTIRQALALRKRGARVFVCYRDIRMAGPGAEEAYREAREAGVVFLRFAEDAPPQVVEREERAIGVRVTETLLHREVRAPVDLVVLGVGLVPRHAQAARVQEMLKTPRGEDGFFLERHPELAPVETCVDGVVLCGAAQGPKDLHESLVQATAAAARVGALLGKGRLSLDPAVCRVEAARCRACGLCVSICQFQAPRIVEREGARFAEINPALCKGCGTCAVWCPTNAIRAAHFTDGQIGAMIDALFTGDRDPWGSPAASRGANAASPAIDAAAAVSGGISSSRTASEEA
ncbi:MAG: CoB--CoM heterodisulfide reductase iron-sulfur subunit A family protein [Candidatus Eisenbacteria bacterium]|nr:CoB--CoM heterodisulfide reductase iron-sulfur subunit A family protein [Candidatus Eisenbacteria bacterium]